MRACLHNIFLLFAPWILNLNISLPEEGTALHRRYILYALGGIPRAYEGHLPWTLIILEPYGLEKPGSRSGSRSSCFTSQIDLFLAPLPLPCPDIAFGDITVCIF
jgi:hypothetical protein